MLVLPSKTFDVRETVPFIAAQREAADTRSQPPVPLVHQLMLPRDA
jgi:hypothetical protein